MIAAGLVMIFLPQKVLADDDDLHVKVEASTDGGNTWHTYDGTEFKDGESVALKPGGWFKFRVKLWNTYTKDMTDIRGYLVFYLNQSKWVFEPLSMSQIDLDTDGNGRSYYGILAEISNLATPVGGMISQLDANGTEETAEICEFSMQVKPEDELPPGEIVVRGVAKVLSYEQSRAGEISVKTAIDVNLYSSFRGVLNVTTSEELVASGINFPLLFLIPFFLSILGWFAFRKFTA